MRVDCYLIRNSSHAFHFCHPFSFPQILLQRHKLLSHQKLLPQLEVGLEAIVGKEEHHVVGGKLSGFVHSLAPWSLS